MQRLTCFILVIVMGGGLVACTSVRPGVGDNAESPLNLPPASENTAVLALLEQAHSESNSGRAAGATATLERALRIEPHNPRLWLELARHHLAQGENGQAEQLARRANGLAGTDRLVRAACWQVIAGARRARGDDAGAGAAEAKVSEYRR